MNILSFFAGSGFLDLGFEKTGFIIKLVNEYFTSFINAYKYSRKQMNIDKPEYGYQNNDINVFLFERKNELIDYVNLSKKESLTGFIGGPPCPDFSVAGKNKGRDGENGKLSLSYINTILECMPDFFLFENVKGLWRTARHRQFFEELKSLLHEAGYCTTEKLVNALEFGVPQDRERILLFGVKSDILGGKHRKQDLIIDFPWEKNIIYKLKNIKNCSWPSETPFKEGSIISRPTNIIEELTVQHWFELNDVNNHLNSSEYFTPKAGLHKMLTINEGDVSKKCFKRLHRWRYSPTAAYGNNEVHLHPYHARRLSVAETLAIQSLPKNFCLPPEMTLSAKFKTIGNGVPYLLAKGIAETIKDYLEAL
jgi:DNA (cytosine-5)-methyltransferase 1